ncbi:MAG: NADH-quinone oxidoreductase subunit NuoE [Candidatus Aminicenantes bacterium]|nr:NADH-quinone oxidoreductase subunit NuoE [Candidatus Aminicenantes bacterium]
MSPEFSDKIKKQMQDIIAHYPKKQAALLPVLHVAQQEFGFISDDTEQKVAALLDIKPVQVREVVTFYTMYNRQQVGKYHIQVCSNLSCSLLGGESLLDFLLKKLKIGLGETTEDKKFTISTVECLGACEQAPCMMVNFDYFGDLDKGKIDKILDNLN